MKNLTLGFLGFGLIGGSIARSLKAKNLPITTIVYTRRQNIDLEQGVSDHIIDKLVYDIDDSFCQCDVIYLCAPVLTNISFLKTLKTLIKPGCIITDVGSVKGNIHRAVTELGMEDCFIGGHPMAGSEKTGYANSTTTLLENAYYLLTPTPKTSNESLVRMEELAAATGAICHVLDAASHDKITAAISHVPHIIATTLVNMVRTRDDENQHMKSFAAGGFKDITRIASSSPEMWENICLSNASSIHEFLEYFIDLLHQFDSHMQSQDMSALHDTFVSAGNYRDSIPGKQPGMISRCFEIFVDIADEPGVIATIATMLATHGINIKNIGIIHNREFAEGVLRIEFYKEPAMEQAITILQDKSYKIIVR